MAGYDLKAILGEKLRHLTYKILKALVDCMCTVGASLNDLDARIRANEEAVSETNLGDRTADRLNVQELLVGGEDVAAKFESKVDKVPAATAGNIVVFNSTGNIASAGKKVGDLVNHGKYTYVQSRPGAGEFSDWNQLTVDGIYSIPNSPEAGTANSPEEDKMTLIVMTSTDSQDRTLVEQLAVGDEMYVRKKTSSGWDASWTQVTRQTWANWVITNTSGITYNMLKAALDAGRAVYLVGYVSNRSYILKATEFSVSQNSVVLFTGITSTGMLATTKCTVQEGWDSNITVSGLPWDGYHLSIGGTPTAGTNTIYFT